MSPARSAGPGPGPARASLVQVRLLFGVVAVVGLTLDVVTKVLVVARLDPYSPVTLLGGLLTLRLIRNSGAAFSQGEGITWVFAVAAILVVGFVLVRLAPRLGHRGWSVALGLLVAGVSGNLVDRLFRAPGVFRGHVVDFLQLPHWPIFNVADMCITTAAVMVVVLALFRDVGVDGQHPVAEPPAQDEPGASTEAAAGSETTGEDVTGEDAAGEPQTGRPAAGAS